MTTDTYSEERDEFVGRIYQNSVATLETATIYLGIRLGLYTALADSSPLSSTDLAHRTEINERYAREWLEQQNVAGIVDVEDSGNPLTRTYSLRPAYADVLTNRDSPHYMGAFAHIAVTTSHPVPQVVDAFRSGEGLPFSVRGEDNANALNNSTRSDWITQAASRWIPAIPQLENRLQRLPSARVADIGCGGGWPGIALAQAFPNIVVDGYDIDPTSIAIARENAHAEGVADRVRFHAEDVVDSPPSDAYDLIISINTVHDLPQPVPMLRAMRRMGSAHGVILLVEPKARETFPGKALDITDPERVLYLFSVLICLTNCLSEQPSVATGTIMRPATLRGYAREAGFSDVVALPIDAGFFTFYQLVV